MDMESANVLLNGFLDRPAGEETLTIMRRRVIRINAILARRNEEFRHDQLARANARETVAALEGRNRNAHQDSDVESEEDPPVHRSRRRGR